MPTRPDLAAFGTRPFRFVWAWPATSPSRSNSVERVAQVERAGGGLSGRYHGLTGVDDEGVDRREAEAGHLDLVVEGGDVAVRAELGRCSPVVRR
jgi:hypothetical protein